MNRSFFAEQKIFILEKRGLERLVGEIVSVNEESRNLLPLDMESTGEGIVRWPERRVIPKNRTFVDEILKTLGLSHNDKKGLLMFARACLSTTAIELFCVQTGL